MKTMFECSSTLGSNVNLIRFTDDGRFALTSNRRFAKLWNPFRLEADNAKEALLIQTYSNFTHPITALTSSSSILLAASDKKVFVIDMVTSQIKRKFYEHHTGRINDVATCTDDKQEPQMLLSASLDGTVAMWDARGSGYNPVQCLYEASDSVTSILVDSSPIIRTASVDGFCRTYDIRMGQLLCDDCGSPITSIALTNDRKCLAISCLDGTIRLMESNTGQLLNTYSGHHKAGQYQLEVQILADDSCVVTGSENGTCCLYDLVRATSVQALKQPSPLDHQRPVCSIATHPKEESIILTASFDGIGTVWTRRNSNLI